MRAYIYYAGHYVISVLLILMGAFFSKNKTEPPQQVVPDDPELWQGLNDALAQKPPTPKSLILSGFGGKKLLSHFDKITISETRRIFAFRLIILGNNFVYYFETL